jgi:hypothetical protein
VPIPRRQDAGADHAGPSRCVRTVREPSANIGHHQSQTVMSTSVMFADANPLCRIATHGFAVEPAFNFQWSWSSGSVAGKAAAH